MKLYLTYGFLIALAGFALILVMFFAGLHGERYELGKTLGLVGFIFPIVGIPLGIRAWRDQVGKGNMSYGAGVGAGFFISVWYGLFSAVFMLLYGMVINPNYQETVIQHEMANLEARGLPANALEGAEKVMRITTHPVFQAVFVVLGALLVGVIIALIASAFLKRQAPVAAVSMPPPLA